MLWSVLTGKRKEITIALRINIKINNIKDKNM